MPRALYYVYFVYVCVIVSESGDAYPFFWCLVPHKSLLFEIFAIYTSVVEFDQSTVGTPFDQVEKSLSPRYTEKEGERPDHTVASVYFLGIRVVVIKVAHFNPSLSICIDIHRVTPHKIVQSSPSQSRSSLMVPIITSRSFEHKTRSPGFGNLSLTRVHMLSINHSAILRAPFWARICRSSSSGK